jgi:hypothetical protein
MVKNRMLRKTHQCKRQEVPGGWTKTHSTELHLLNSSQNIQLINSRKIRLAGHVEHMGERKGAYRN